MLKVLQNTNQTGHALRPNQGESSVSDFVDGLCVLKGVMFHILNVGSSTRHHTEHHVCDLGHIHNRVGAVSVDLQEDQSLLFGNHVGGRPGIRAEVCFKLAHSFAFNHLVGLFAGLFALERLGVLNAVVDKGLSNLRGVTVFAQTKEGNNFGSHVVELLFTRLDSRLVQELFVVLSDKVESSSLHQKFFSLQFPLLVERVVALLFVQGIQVLDVVHNIAGLTATIRLVDLLRPCRLGFCLWRCLCGPCCAATNSLQCVGNLPSFDTPK